MAPADRPAVPKASLGTAGFFLLPAGKLSETSARGLPFEKEVHEFLLTNYNGYTFATGQIYGHWKDPEGREWFGHHREYTVALPHPAARHQLEVFLAGLADELDEECIYLEIGGEACLVYRRRI